MLMICYLRCTTASETCTGHEFDIRSRRGEFARLAATRRLPHFRPSMGIGEIDAFGGGRTCAAHVNVT